jgi:hypothetical protein
MGLSISRSIVEITAGGFGWRRMKVPGQLFLRASIAPIPKRAGCLAMNELPHSVIETLREDGEFAQA